MKPETEAEWSKWFEKASTDEKLKVYASHMVGEEENPYLKRGGVGRVENRCEELINLYGEARQRWRHTEKINEILVRIFVIVALILVIILVGILNNGR